MKLVHDIENDLAHTIPPVGGLDSQSVFATMTRRCLALLDAKRGETIVDLACGMGQDTLAVGDGLSADTLPQRPTRVIGLEPSSRMIGWGRHGQRQRSAGGGTPPVHFVRGLAEELPLRSGCADGLLCKGALDHFMDPGLTMDEIWRVLRPGGRAVIALANYDSLSCKLGRLLDRIWPAPRAPGTHRYFDPPPDHLTRFGFREIATLAKPPFRLERVEGVSLLWNFPPWSATVGAVPAPAGRMLVNAALKLAHGLPRAADVVILSAVKP